MYEYVYEYGFLNPDQLLCIGEQARAVRNILFALAMAIFTGPLAEALAR